MKMAKSKVSGTVAVIMVMLAALFTWSFYRLLYTASGDILLSFGVVNEYWQNGMILIIAGAILYFVGKKSLKGMIK